MVSEWRQVCWGDIATLEYGKGLRGYQEKIGTYRVFGTNGPIGWHDEPLCPFSSVIIGRKGAYRGIHFSPAPFFVIDTAFYLKPKKTFNMKWAYYELLTHDINNMDSGSAIPSTSRESFYKLPVWVPPTDEQQAIAHILGSLDDRIELNRRMNNTLETMARTIFKSWFVDFDPVHAKIEGRPTGLPDEVASLFPDSFEDSELGEIPKGWKVVALPEIIDINPSRKLKKGQVAPYLEMKNLSQNTARAVCWCDRNFSSGVKFINGDTLMARITPCLENGKGAFVDFLEDGQVGWGSTEYIVFRAKEPLPLEYSYFLSRTKDFRSHAIVNMTGSSGRQRVPASIFDDYLVVRPSENIAESFGIFSGLVMRKIKENDEMTRSLASLRDTLLPKLISGELRVPDAERFIEEAGL
ncbi:MAG: restriction endonuclease subunit S [Synergistales bacterium]|nr:restriction endonuclease subunit S [Synergistales bacterium]